MTFDLINKENLSKETIEVLKKLNVATSYSEDDLQDSVMTYGVICNCDSGYLCQHRLQWIGEEMNEDKSRHVKMTFPKHKEDKIK